MKCSRLFVTSCLIGSLGWAMASVAAEAPSIDSILTKYVAAMGGKTAIEKVKTRVVKVKIESENFGASEGEVFAKAPNKTVSHIEISGSGAVEEGFDGAVAWAKSPWEALRVKAGDELVKAKHDADFYRDLKLKTLFPDLAFKGTETVENEETFVLESKPTASSLEKYWFSGKSGLVIRRDSEYEGPQGKVVVSAFPQDYKTIEGIKYPGKMKLRFSVGGQTMEFNMTFTEMKINVPIDDAKFAKPSA